MALSHSEPVRFVIVGGGSAGWIAASLLQHHGKAKNWQITLVEASDIAPIGVGEGSTPYLKHFFKQLGIAEAEWMPECQATYKVGIEFPDWSTQPGFESYFHPFFTPLDLNSGEAFMTGACARRRGHKTPAHPDSFWVASAMARQKRSPVAKKPLPFEIDYGYHFDAGLLGQFLKRRAVKLGVRHIVDKIDRVEKNNHGDIARLHCQDVLVGGDVFIDCSGFSQRLESDPFLHTPYC